MTVVALIIPLIGLSAEPAAATTATTGNVAFEGTANLPIFPCQPPAPFGNGPCTGSFSGDWTGALSGVSGTSPFEVTWTTNTNNAIQIPSFTYAEWDCNLHAETVLGIARGSGTAVAGPGQVDGNWQAFGDTFPRDITDVSLTFSFRWTRLTTTAIITIEPATLQLKVSGIGWVTVVDSSQSGTAAFVPTSTSGTNVPTCDSQTAVTGIIAGEVPVAGTL